MKLHLFLALAIALAVSTSALGDGTITVTPTTPDHWRISSVNIRMGDVPVTNIFVEYLLPDETIDHVQQVRVTGDARYSLLDAMATPSGADEASLTTTVAGNVRADSRAIIVLRISRWLIAQGYISGVTAQPVASLNIKALPDTKALSGESVATSRPHNP